MEKLRSLTDDELLLEFNSSDNLPAFIEIYNRYHAVLYSAACKRCISTEIAEEIVQELFINLWRNKAVIKINVSLSGYLFTATRNLVLNHIQKESVRRKYQQSFSLEVPDYDNSTEETLIANDLKSQIENKLNTLPEKCRSVFELSRKQHKSNKEIAYELGISEKTVENHITRAIRFLRVGLQIFIVIMTIISCGQISRLK